MYKRLINRSYAKNAEIGICHMFYMVFERNNLDCFRLTDLEILILMREEFPNRDNKFLKDVDGIKVARRCYNNGIYSQKLKPRIKSMPYDKNGREIKLKPGPQVK